MGIELVVPSLGESITEAVISKWLKNVGDPIGIDEPVADLETDKVSIALPAPVAGVLTEQRFAVGATVKVGQVIGVLEKAATDTRPASPPASREGVTQSHNSPALPAPSHRSPTARRALREGATPAAPAAPTAPTAPSSLAPGPTVNQAGDAVEVVPMTPLRKRIAERLVEAQHTAAILTTFNEIDMSAVMALRSQYQESFTARHGVKLGFMSFFVRGCAEALKLYPGLNAELRGSDILYKKHYHFGIAVGSGRGLVVPVLRNVDRLSLAEIERGVATLAERAKDNKLTLDELQNGTFSITNGGIYGSMMSTPLLNMPQTGILGMHNILRRPIAVGDEVKIRPMMYVALSYDHRVVDGREAVQFLVGLKQRIEAPERLLLEI